jgi:pyridoxal phosphate enzyme (YggS family)
MTSSSSQAIRLRVHRVLHELPRSVEVVAAVKGRSLQEIVAVIEAGIHIIGHNYVQEADASRRSQLLAATQARVHMIGHLQRNKVSQAVRLFDAIQSVDSLRIAEKIDHESGKIGRVMPVLIEVNSGREPGKTGVSPESVIELARLIAALPNLRLDGLMTMGPVVEDPEALRPFFRETKRTFDSLAAQHRLAHRPTTLSMGMSSSYRIAVAEGATMVRLGTVLFGPRFGEAQ